MKERLVLVERFEELTPGVRVVCQPCNLCGGIHRGMVGNRMDWPAVWERGVALIPPAPCGAQGIAERAVPLRLVWRFVDFDAASEAADARSLRISERVR